jgi:AICAR transformylase/IMP cyclohydrolase PurH
MSLQQTLRYGENPHQSAAFLLGPFPRGGGQGWRSNEHPAPRQGIFNENYLDADAAYSTVCDFPNRRA